MQRRKKSSHANQMKTLRIIFVTGIAFLLLFQSSCSTQSHLKHYSGDGEPKIIPTPFFVNDGYAIQFKPISLDKPAEMTYHFKGLPKVAWQVEVYFVVEGSQEWESKDYYEWQQLHHPNDITKETAVIDDLKGTLEMSLKDTKGNIIFQVTNVLSKLTWSQGDHTPAELYDSKTFFTTSIVKEYILDVSIVPDPILKNDKGYILFRSGGWEPISIGF